jgi:putative holliday junction resolvase
MIIYDIEIFCTYLKIGQPIVGIDYGEKKIGLAISTPDHRMCVPFSLIEENSEKKKINRLTEFIRNKDACAIVVGRPYHMNGTKSSQTLIVEKFAQKLSNKIHLPIFLQDERLTSKAADNLLKSFGLKRKKRNETDDIVAANMILETTLRSCNLL